jgi:hypothetical protein
MNAGELFSAKKVPPHPLKKALAQNNKNGFVSVRIDGQHRKVQSYN